MIEFYRSMNDIISAEAPYRIPLRGVSNPFMQFACLPSSGCNMFFRFTCFDVGTRVEFIDADTIDTVKEEPAVEMVEQSCFSWTCTCGMKIRLHACIHNT